MVCRLQCKHADHPNCLVSNICYIRGVYVCRYEGKRTLFVRLYQIRLPPTKPQPRSVHHPNTDIIALRQRVIHHKILFPRNIHSTGTELIVVSRLEQHLPLPIRSSNALGARNIARRIRIVARAAGAEEEEVNSFAAALDDGRLDVVGVALALVVVETIGPPMVVEPSDWTCCSMSEVLVEGWLEGLLQYPPLVMAGPSIL